VREFSHTQLIQPVRGNRIKAILQYHLHDVCANLVEHLQDARCGDMTSNFIASSSMIRYRDDIASGNRQLISTLPIALLLYKLSYIALLFCIILLNFKEKDSNMNFNFVFL